jgi:hypothetical protein
MNTRKRLLKALTMSVVAIGFAMLITSGRDGLVPTASAQEPAVRERQRGLATLFGMQTLASAQTAQITVVNPLEIIPCVRVRLALDIYEADPTSPGRLRFVRSVSREVELEPGEAASIEYTAGGRGAFVSPASFVREINEVGDPHSTFQTRAIIAISSLVINERGRVVFTAPGVRVGFDPQPDPPAN